MTAPATKSTTIVAQAATSHGRRLVAPRSVMSLASPPPGDPADRRRDRSARGPDGRAVPDVAPVAPLAVAVDARHLDVDDRHRDADHDREVLERGLPELVVLTVAAELVGDLVERVGRPLERRRLGHDRVAVLPCRERDPG